jgi:hypothetical protein
MFYICSILKKGLFRGEKNVGIRDRKRMKMEKSLHRFYQKTDATLTDGQIKREKKKKNRLKETEK